MEDISSISLSAANDHATDYARQWAYALIVAQIMKAGGISARDLARQGIISDRARKSLTDRIKSGHLTKAEADRINDYLQIDPIRLHIAIHINKDPESYFDQSTEMAATYSHEIGHFFRENSAAKEGDFGPIGHNLARAHAQKITKEFVQHVESVDRFRQSPLGHG